MQLRYLIMSIYGPRLKLPRIEMPDISIPDIKMPKINLKKIGILLIIILIISTLIFSYSILTNFGSPIAVYWNNNPLYLDETTNYSELTLILTNNTENTKNINLSVTTESKELIIFCPEDEFPNVASGKFRETTCVIRRNPNERIFTGTYDLLINTNIGETITTLQIVK